VRREEVPLYLAHAKSDDPKDRFEAAAHLCPCHIRHPIPEVQTAQFRLLEDSDPDVRARAWHTLEDGGVPDDSPWSRFSSGPVKPRQLNGCWAL
jgi:hypothetical protein